MCVVMIELDIMVDKRGPFELRVLFDRVECDWVLEDHGIEIVDTVKGETIQTDGNDDGDGSHVQEQFGRRSKRRGLIYPGNDPEWVMPNWSYQVLQGTGHRRSCCGEREATAVERSVLRRSSLGQVAE